MWFTDWAMRHGAPAGTQPGVEDVLDGVTYTLHHVVIADEALAAAGSEQIEQDPALRAALRQRWLDPPPVLATLRTRWDQTLGVFFEVARADPQRYEDPAAILAALYQVAIRESVW